MMSLVEFSATATPMLPEPEILPPLLVIPVVRAVLELYLKCAPDPIVIPELELMEPPVPMASVPWETLVAPVKVLAPVSCKVPVPVLLKPGSTFPKVVLLLITPAIVNVLVSVTSMPDWLARVTLRLLVPAVPLKRPKVPVACS